MLHSALVPWLDPNVILSGVNGLIALGVVCAIIFAETGLLIGFILPGDTLLFFTGVLAGSDKFGVSVWLIGLCVAAAAWLGGEAGYLIGRVFGPSVFERKESGFFSKTNVDRTNSFMERWGAFAVVIARFVPIVRTFAPVAAGIGKMNYRKYSLYNVIGALLWSYVVILAGYVLGQIPFVRTFAEKYLDVVLVGIVVITVIPTVIHAVRTASKAKRARLAEDAATAEQAATAAPEAPSPSTDAR